MPTLKPLSYNKQGKAANITPDQHPVSDMSKSEPNSKSSETLTSNETSDSSSMAPTLVNKDGSVAGHKELTALERIKLEREHEKANPQKPLFEAEGVWKSKLWVIPTALLYGLGG